MKYRICDVLYSLLVLIVRFSASVESLSEMKPASSPHVQRLVHSMCILRNERKAVTAAMFLKDRFPSLGIQRPDRALIQKKWFAELKKDTEVDQWELASELWDLKYREFQYVAIDYLKTIPKRKYKPEDHIKIAKLITTKPWWDTVDVFASNIVGTYFQAYPEMIHPVITEWRQSGKDMWLNRTCLLFQLRYKDKTDFDLLQELVMQYLEVDEFFIQKAIGWSLRHYSRTDPNAVREFVKDLDLSPVAKREATKYI